MNFDLLKRLRRLEAVTAQTMAGKTAFTLENGSRFYAEADPLTYLLQHGPESPRGRIVGYEHEKPKDADPITISLYGCIGELIVEGTHESR
mgnify:CR=1 FL=1